MNGLTLSVLLAASQTIPIDWSTLPPIPFRTQPQLTQSMHRFVQREAITRRCPLPPPVDRTVRMRVDLAVRVDSSGAVRTIIPRAIDCPTVEQYAVGLVSGFTQNNLLPRSATGDVWYRTSVTFAWRR